MKKAYFLAGDYWHHADTIEPLSNVLFDKDTWQVTFTKNLLCEEYVKLMKNAIEWCTNK